MLNSTQIISLLNIKGIGTHTVHKIWSANKDFTDIKEIYNFLQEMNLKPNRYSLPTYEVFREQYNGSEDIIEKTRANNIHIISLGENKYPEQLSNIPNPPLVLYVKGNIECLNTQISVAIIGTRKPTDYGQKVAQRLGEYFAENNFVVVSGLAEGCDTGAHLGCLSKNGKTIAVLAHGLDKIFPSKNKVLANEIIEKCGCLVSEYAIGVPPIAGNFVARDRIQSGLSLGVLVVETGIKSGTMHTVKFCREQNRILACHKHPDRYQNMESVLGNVQLLSEGAWAIEDSTSLNNYKEKLFSLLKENRGEKVSVIKQSEKGNDYPLFKDIDK